MITCIFLTSFEVPFPSFLGACNKQESEKEQNVDMVSEELDSIIISSVEDILKIHVPTNSKIRRKNSRNKVTRRQNGFSDHGIQSQDFLDVLPNGTTLVRS